MWRDIRVYLGWFKSIWVIIQIMVSPFKSKSQIRIERCTRHWPWQFAAVGPWIIKPQFESETKRIKQLSSKSWKKHWLIPYSHQNVSCPDSPCHLNKSIKIIHWLGSDGERIRQFWGIMGHLKPSFHKANFDHDNDQFWAKTKWLVGRITAQQYNRSVFLCLGRGVCCKCKWKPRLMDIKVFNTKSNNL